MNDILNFRAWFDGRFIYKSLCDSNVYTEDNKCICLANTLPDLPWEQCTGLKDKNGKLIYVGDIVEHKILPDKPKKYIVKWSYTHLCFELQSIKNPLFYDVFIPEYDDVIGNIHENPELLKESK